ncbi:Fascin domain protein [uncultured archaeon]|nr:Fascin domain protein [uncultured archaeon]
MATAYLARWGGPVNEVDDPYPWGDEESGTDNAYPIQKHTQNVYFLPGRTSSTDNDNIKWALTTYGGLDAAIFWNNIYYSATPATYYNPSTTHTNHEVTLVGWDDNYAAANFRGAGGAPPGDGAFIAKNSWGTSWGDRGYFYLSYYDTSLRSVTAFTAEPASNFAAEYQYDPLGWVANVGYLDTTAWGANVFTADSSAKPLTAVSFYTNDVNTQYEVYIYTDLTSEPIGGKQYAGPKGTMPSAGYHTVRLASPVPLKAGQRFSVVVKFTTSGYGYPLATECFLEEYSSNAAASLGQSYCSPDGSDWLDLFTFDSTMNVCIKAFTSDRGDLIALRAANGLYVSARGGDGMLIADGRTIGAWETFKLIDLGNGKVALQAANGKYLSIIVRGGRAVAANRNTIGPWETFKLIDQRNGNFALQAANGQYVCAPGRGGRVVMANLRTAGIRQTLFRFMDLRRPAKVALQASNGQYLGVEDTGARAVAANRNAIGAGEMFKLIDRGDGNVALQAANGRYVSAQGSGVVANRDTIGTWETFGDIYRGNGKVALQAVNGRYVYAKSGGGDGVAANGKAIGAWETFSLIPT